MNEFQIKSLIEEDYETFHHVYSQILFEAFPEFSQKVKNLLSSKKMTKKRFTNPIKFGGFVSNQMVGYILTNKPEAGVIKIDWIGVKKEFQQQGTGTALIIKAEEEARKLGAHNMQLVCDKHLVEFYTAKGYEVLGFDKKSYFGYDVYIMKKLLQEPNESLFLK